MTLCNRLSIVLAGFTLVFLGLLLTEEIENALLGLLEQRI
jgi:uncharacterized membrane protein